MFYGFKKVSVFVLICLAVGLRSIVSLSSYSGASSPPLFGDYEAQRHWQEVTYNLPAKQWYSNTTDNDLLYWGLDYPPLTAYHSLVLGIAANRMNSSYVELFKSRGFESSEHKSFMRLTVLAADLVVYIPSSMLVAFSLHSGTTKYMLPFLVLLLLFPCQILVDNGHFQYNNISLGLYLVCIACLLQNRRKVASFAFSMALNYKQMELYHALPIFVYLLKASFSDKSISKNIFQLIEVGFVTATTFLLLWMPWISSIDSFSTALLRLFPLNRGVFEDKVANVWCSLNTIYKFKENLSNHQMALVCLTATLIAIIPPNIHLFLNLKRKTLLLAMVNTSLAFFLLSFQVHEKSILLAAVPVCLLFEMMPLSVLCFLQISTFSILPLLIKDNLHITYFCMMICYLIIFKYLIQIVYSKDKKTQQHLNICKDLLDLTILAASLATLFLPSPERLPYLYPFLISFFCCVSFVIFWIYSNCFQYSSFIFSIRYLKDLPLKFTH